MEVGGDITLIDVVAQYCIRRGYLSVESIKIVGLCEGSGGGVRL